MAFGQSGGIPRNGGNPDGYAFGGLRVIDFGIGAVGVEAGRLLAEYGAEVIKVESRTYPDFIRIIEGSFMTPPFSSSSRTKQSLGVNVRTPNGLDVVRRLIQRSDILIENSGAGVMDRMGLSWEAVHAINPRIIMVSSQLAGAHGPWSKWIGYGPSTHPFSGLTWLWNYFEDMHQPAGSQNIYPDHLVGRMCAALAAAGLLQRERTGTGCHMEVAQFEMTIAMLGDLFLQESISPGSVTPQGNDSERGAPWGAFPSVGEDSWCVINVRDDGEWQRLRAALGDPEWARDAAYATSAGRIAARAALNARLGEWTAQRTSLEAMETLQAAGVACGMMQNPAEQLDDPHLVERGYPQRIEQPPIGPLVLEGPAFRGSDLAGPIVLPAPDLGEQTRDICARILGMSAGEIDTLISEGVLEEPQAAAAS